jgi:hypothetical protein
VTVGVGETDGADPPDALRSAGYAGRAEVERVSASQIGGQVLKLPVQGMTCDGCAARCGSGSAGWKG